MDMCCRVFAGSILGNWKRFSECAVIRISADFRVTMYTLHVRRVSIKQCKKQNTLFDNMSNCQARRPLTYFNRSLPPRLLTPAIIAPMSSTSISLCSGTVMGACVEEKSDSEIPSGLSK